MSAKSVKFAAAFIRRTSGGFTLVELMVVILIIGILAGAAVPLMRGRVDSAKWSEADAACGTIWTGIRTYIAEKGPEYPADSYTADLVGSLDDGAICVRLGINPTDLEGRYFSQGDYAISSIDASGPSCIITVTSTINNGPNGQGRFQATLGKVTWQTGG